MALPTVLEKNVKYPADLGTQAQRDASNGKLPDSVLVALDEYGGRVHRNFLRCWLAYKATVKLVLGIDLTYSSVADAYRTFNQQKTVFTQRYKPVSAAVYLLTPSARRKRWYDAAAYGYSSTYWIMVKLSNGDWPATAAEPGDSNHGLGLALDHRKGSKPQGEYVGDQGTKYTEWAKLNLARFGFAYETQSEPWHIRLVCGDDIPQAVLDYEASLHPIPVPPPFQGEDMSDIKVIDWAPNQADQYVRLLLNENHQLEWLQNPKDSASAVIVYGDPIVLPYPVTVNGVTDWSGQDALLWLMRRPQGGTHGNSPWDPKIAGTRSNPSLDGEFKSHIK